MTTILSIDTSCDETSAAVTKKESVLSNVIWSQASLHAKWGGVVPSLAKRAHNERIDFVVQKAVTKAFTKSNLGFEKLLDEKIDAIAVTAGPGLAIALEVGINKAKEISKTFNKPLVTVNHIEGHLLSSLAHPDKREPKKVSFPALGLITSGKHTDLVFVYNIGNYKVLASTVDDALGEALDKAARMLGFGYPGGHIIEELSKIGDPEKYPLPIPLLGQENRMIFSYSGIKAALFRKVEEIKVEKKTLSKGDINDLASSFQKSAFAHFTNVLDYFLLNEGGKEVKSILAGGGVISNTTLRNLIRKRAQKHNLQVFFPYSSRLYCDNAAMIGIAAFHRFTGGEAEPDINIIERLPNISVDKKLKW